ncbi:DUF3787 domain-containing protein [Lutibacter sp. B2]|nr:DUF3787 domain-containing protein [Lutibacter sp. B2]
MRSDYIMKIKKNTHPIENQKTAAWANIHSLKLESSVPIPTESEVINAKEWVEDNEK